VPGKKSAQQAEQIRDRETSPCRWKGQPVPCSTADGWYDAATGCYLSLQPDRPVLGVDPTIKDPALKKYRCAQIVAVIDGRPIVEATLQPVFRRQTTPVVDPRVAARAVVARMSMRAIAIGMVPRPGRTGYVNVPVWMWAADPGPQTTGPQTVTETEQGLSITATAKLSRIVWNMGDGTTITCGPGTPYTETTELEESPDCGHRYLRASKRYRVTATSYWTVDWRGGGTQGRFSDLSFSRSAQVAVAELRPVLVAPGG
jgi:hypothetical protein